MEAGIVYDVVANACIYSLFDYLLKLKKTLKYEKISLGLHTWFSS